MIENNTPSSILNDEERRANAQRAIIKTMKKFMIVKIGVTAVVAATIYVITKKLEDEPVIED